MRGGGGSRFSVYKVYFWILIKSVRFWRTVKVLDDLSVFRVRSTLILIGLYGLVNMQPDLYLESLESYKVHPKHHESLWGSFLSESKYWKWSWRYLLVQGILLMVYPKIKVFSESSFLFKCSDIMTMSCLFLWDWMSIKTAQAVVFKTVEKTVFAVAGSMKFLFSLPYQAGFFLW